ncbi:hypothetical protein KXJ69_10330 [Aureisphaera sp. CAU 1614]|uniref:Uncharacterized protein n=1 Tax=Halomarinibacterium sedimenti TaxID=2857106 RepID=A0A9X1K0J1_9FLAO|nr:DUF6090 family protein [Halomarinibacterium sedimenti]MBW2938506.1 hypothetical protein [Halomarinibacterium sedimenti]
MIKFFRRIRQKLLSENKFSKYLLYAIGEIVLVVIGILIALQINNWNEERKLKTEELKMLRNFRTTIAGDLEEVRWYGRAFDRADNSIHIILTHMKEGLPYHDSLRGHFRNKTSLWSPKIDQEVFETMTSTDLNIISNDSLKKELISYYSFAKRTFDVRMNRYATIMEDASKNIFIGRFNEFWGNSWDDPDYKENLSEKTMTPIDYEKLKKDDEYLYFIKSLKNQLFWYVRNPLSQAKEKSERLIMLLDEEIKKLEK